MVRQNWMAASENVWLRPRLPLGAASHCMSLLSQMVKSPRAFNAALYAFQFVVRYLRRPQLVSLITRAYRTCDRHLCNNAVLRLWRTRRRRRAAGGAKRA